MFLRPVFGFFLRRSWLLLLFAIGGAALAYLLAEGDVAWGAAGAGAGLMVGLIAGLLLDIPGRSLKSPNDLAALGVTVAGSVIQFKRQDGSASPRDEYPEAVQTYREVAGHLRQRDTGAGFVLLITSALPEEGKSTTAANLALMLAKTGKRVVLVDGDLRWPSLRSTEDAGEATGLGGLLLEPEEDILSAVIAMEEANLSLLPAGVLPAEPDLALASPHFGEVIDSLREAYDFVLIDSPPLLENRDAMRIAGHADEALVVVHAGKLPSRRFRRALQRLSTAADEIPVTVLLNRIRLRKRDRIVPIVAPQPLPIPADVIPATAAAVEEQQKDAVPVAVAVRISQNGKNAAAAANGLAVPQSTHAVAAAPPPVLLSLTDEALESTFDDALSSLEETLSLIRSLRQQQKAEDNEADETEPPEEPEPPPGL